MVWETSSKRQDFWDARIQRADELAEKHDAAKELLTFYAKLLRAQKAIYECLRGREGWLPTGLLEEDLRVVRVDVPELLRSVEASGTDKLVEEAKTLLRASDNEIDRMLIGFYAPELKEYESKLSEANKLYIEMLSEASIPIADQNEEAINQLRPIYRHHAIIDRICSEIKAEVINLSKKYL